MPPAKSLRRPFDLVVFDDATSSPASTTLASAAAAGAFSIVVASATNIAAGDALRLGSGTDLEVVIVDNGYSSGTTVSIENALTKAHPAGTVVVEQLAHRLGETEGGVTITKSVESNDVVTDQRRLVYNTALGFASVMAEGRVYGLTLPRWCFALGIPLNAISGSGTASAPHALTLDFSEVGTALNRSMALASYLNDGTLKIEELHGIDVDHTVVSLTLARGQPVAMPWRFSCFARSVEEDIAAGGAVDWTAVTTHTPKKDDIFAGWSAIGYWSAAASPTTAASAIAAGATTIVCADASGIAAEDWVLVDTGAALETHWVLSKSTNTLTLKTPVKAAHASGVRVAKGVRNDFAGIQRGSVQYALGGSATDDYVEERQLGVGKTPGNVQLTLTMALRDLTVATRARALGIPASAISNGRMVTSELLGTSAIEAVYLIGSLKSGATIWWNLWGAAQQLASFATTYNGQQPDQAATPFVVRPSGGVQKLQYTA